MRIKALISRLIQRQPVAVEPLRTVQKTGRGVIPTASIQVVAPEEATDHGVPRYPPLDNGISVATPDEILASQGEIIRTLKKNLGISDEEFEKRYLAPLRRAAEYVNLLPATRDKHHTGAGGLFRFAALMAIRSSQSAGGLIFAASESIERRRDTELAWARAAFLTGLTCELFRALSDMLIVDESGNEWSPYVESLTAWAKRRGVSKYFVRWHARDDVRSSANSLSSFAVTVVLSNELLSELNTVKPAIVETIFGVASGAITTADNNTMATLINQVRRRVIEKDHDIASTTYGKLTSGSHLEPYFVDAMRALLRSGVWQVNSRGSRCHYGTDGFYVAWRLGATEILGHLAQQKINGVPTSRETLLEMMGRAGIITVSGDGSWTHMIRPSTGNGSPMPAIKLQSPTTVLVHLDIAPVPESLRVQANKAPSPKPQPLAVTPAALSPTAATPTPSALEATPVSPKGPIDQSTGEITEPVTAQALDSKAPKERKRKAQEAPGDTPVEEPPAIQPIPKTGIPSVPDDGDDVLETFDKGLLVDLGAPICREIADMSKMWNRGQNSHEFLRTPEGLAISSGRLQQCLISFAQIVEALKDNGFIETQMISGKQRTLNKIPFPKKEELGIVLKAAFARKAGFILE